MTVTIFTLLWWSGPEPYCLLDVLCISVMMTPILIMKKSKFLIMKKLSNHILHIIADFQTTCSNAKFHAFLHYIIPVCMWYNVLSVTNNRWIFSLSVREELGGNKDPSDFLTSLPISITLTSKCAYGWFLLRLWKPDLTLLGLVQGEDSWESLGQQGDQTSQS